MLLLPFPQFINSKIGKSKIVGLANWKLYVSDVKCLLTAIQDSGMSQDNPAGVDECLTPPYSSLNSSTASPCSTVTDSQGPQSPLFQEDLSPVAIEGFSFIVPFYVLYFVFDLEGKNGIRMYGGVVEFPVEVDG